MARTIGLIAGVGRLPHVFASAVRERGERLVVVQAVGEALNGAYAGAAVHDVFFGRWSEVVEVLKKENPDRVYLAGKISRERLFTSDDFDDRFQRVMASLTKRNDDAVVEGFIADLEREGMTVGEQSEYLSPLMPRKGVLSRRGPTPEEWDDVARGFEVAKAVAGLDVGQTVVVKGGAVLAVEAIDGTDAAIARGAGVARKGAVVVKVAKPNQDMRFDVPTVGVDTLETMAKHGASTLAFEADMTFLIDREEVVSFADREGMCLVSYTPDLKAT